jgi:hypothetical protein
MGEEDLSFQVFRVSEDKAATDRTDKTEGTDGFRYWNGSAFFPLSVLSVKSVPSVARQQP